MGKRASVLDWQMLEGNAEWPPPSVLTSAHAPKLRRLPRRWRWWALAALLAVLLSALATGFLEMRRANQTMTRVENEVRTAVAADDWNLQHRVQAAGTTTPLRVAPSLESSLEPHMEARIEARHVEVRGEYAMVELWVTESDLPWLPAPYRQTRFYQETAQGWLPTEPPDAFYAPLAALQAGRFTFVYGPRDADAVLAAAQQVEALDADLRAELGLPPTHKALRVRLVTANILKTDQVELVGMSQGARLFAPSPAVLPLPAQLFEGDALLQLVAGLLIKHNIDEALAGSMHSCAWPALVTGVQRSILWEHTELPSQIRYYFEDFRHSRRRSVTQPHLTDLSPYPSACLSGEIDWPTRYTPWSYDTATAFVDYALAAYGRDRLPALIEGMRRYDSWEALIPAIYGVSPAEFETAWQDYLVHE